MNLLPEYPGKAHSPPLDKCLGVADAVAGSLTPINELSQVAAPQAGLPHQWLQQMPHTPLPPSKGPSPELNLFPIDRPSPLPSPI